MASERARDQQTPASLQRDEVSAPILTFFSLKENIKKANLDLEEQQRLQPQNDEKLSVMMAKNII